MSKELEILEEISKEEVLFKNRNTIYMGGEKANSFTYKDTIGNHFKGIEDIKQALIKAQKQEQKLEFLNATLDFTDGTIKSSFYHNDIKVIAMPYERCKKLEEENAYIEKIKTMMKQKDCVLRYIESEDCFAVKTILSDEWYKLTPEFVDNNVREEIKPLPLIEKNKQLKEENAEYKKVLKIIIEKNIDVETLKYRLRDKNDDVYLHFKYDFIMTREEFDLLKRWLENE